jgi:hypothetical protein
VSCETGYSIERQQTGAPKKVLDWIHVGTIQKTICAPARQLENSISEIVLFLIASAPTQRWEKVKLAHDSLLELDLFFELKLS